MGLDRRIRIVIYGAGVVDAWGRYTQGAPEYHDVWAEYRAQSQELRLELGITTQNFKTWRVRYLQCLIDASELLPNIEIIDGGLTYKPTNIVEDTGKYDDMRRRYILIHGVHDPQ